VRKPRPVETSGLPKGTVLYVVQQERTGLIKIGVTTDIESRIATLESFCGERITPLGLYHIRDFETHLHEIAKAHRTMGEWFVPDVLTVIEPLLPKRRGKPFLARCTMCDRWFKAKHGTGVLCSSDLCRKKQVKLAAQLARAAGKVGGRPRTLKVAKPIQVSNCAVCGTRLERHGPGRPRKICDSADCHREYGRRCGERGQSTRSNVRCLIPGCHALAVCRGWCARHYARWRAHGDPQTLRPHQARVKGLDNNQRSLEL